MSRLLLLALAACTGKGPDLDALKDPETCASCHPVHFEQWESSMHAYASEDPLFLALNAKGQRETNGELGDFCVQCHAPLAVRAGLTEDGLNLPDLDRTEKGITCYFCHSVDGVEGRHNNPLTLAEDGVLRGGIRNPVANPVHASRYSRLLDRNEPESSAMCGSCHDILTPAGVHIERTYGEWQDSLFSRSDRPGQNLNCGSCHMGGVDDVVADMDGEELPVRRRHSHLWPGVDVAVTDFPGRAMQMAAVQDELDGVLLPQLCVAPDPVGNSTQVTVSLENLASGHSFPSGAAADRRTWVQLIAYAGDTELFRSGGVDASTPLASLDDPQLWWIGDHHFDAQGQTTHLFWEVDSYTSDLLRAPTARDPSDPEWIDTHQVRPYTFEGAADRVEMVVRMRPFGLEIVDLLIEEEDLDPAIRDALPTFDLASSRLEWTAALGRPCVLDNGAGPPQP